ncbi:MAG: hypothetical protein ACE5Q6_03050 [Dehalococcoidia bacterium]
MEILNPMLGYAGRTFIGLILALVLATLGVILGRMAIVFLGFISFEAFFSSFLAGVSIGAGVGSLIAWLWLRHTGPVFAATLLLLAILGGALGGWGGYIYYGVGYEVECCARKTIVPQVFAVLGATLGANLMALCFGVTGHLVLRNRRSTHN